MSQDPTLFVYIFASLQSLLGFQLKLIDTSIRHLLGSNTSSEDQLLPLLLPQAITTSQITMHMLKAVGMAFALLGGASADVWAQFCSDTSCEVCGESVDGECTSIVIQTETAVLPRCYRYDTY